MRILDSHAHIFPERIAPAAVRATEEFYSNIRTKETEPPPASERGSGTVDDLLARCARAGVTGAVVFSAATLPRQVESINDFIAASCREHPELIGAGTMHAGYPDMDRETERMKALGLRGAKIHPDIQGFDLDDERLLPFYDRLRAEGMFVIAHTGDYRYDRSAPRRLARVARLFPELRLVGAHFGGWSQWEEARECLAGLPNVYVDTSSTLNYGNREAAIKGFAAFDPTHIFFGSDYPMGDPGAELERLRSLGLGEETLRGVLGENLARFLGEA